MHSTNHLYPVSPQHVSPAATQTSEAFKKEIGKVMGSILLFAIVYIGLISLAAVLALACVYGGIMLIINFPKFFTLMIGVGIIGLGVMVLFFLVKFIFAVARFDRSGSVEITETAQPALFAFIRQLTIDTRTPFPKKIFLSPEVNACVFYDSGFWSMFFPVKKNLQIGLGLVNALSLSEFKAVMAHEFGHFSQRSMKLGSFVYNVNRVLHNMLLENNSYGTFLQQWANISGYFAFFASITVKIIHAIQWILQKLYAIINKSYMSLSREMEFHADAVAASVSGSEYCINALRRLELADVCYNAVINKYSEWYKEKIGSENFYINQQSVLQFYGRKYNLAFENGLPVVGNELKELNNSTRVNYKDQWASHPSIEDREGHLRTLDIKAENRTESAWVLFDNVPQLQQQLTAKMYEQAGLTTFDELFTFEKFEARFEQEIALRSFPERFKNFYDNRAIKEMDIDALVAVDTAIITQFDTLYSAEHVSLPKKIELLNTDIAILKAIDDKQVDIKTFDFDGQKFNREEAATIAAKLEVELADASTALEEVDKAAFVYYYRLALKQQATTAEAFKLQYQQMFKDAQQETRFYDCCNDIIALFKPLYTGEQLSMENVQYMVNSYKRDKEQDFKRDLVTLVNAKILDADEKVKETVEKFIAADYQFCSTDHLFENEFGELRAVITNSANLFSNYRFTTFKALLEFKLTLADKLN